MSGSGTRAEVHALQNKPPHMRQWWRRLKIDHGPDVHPTASQVSVAWSGVHTGRGVAMSSYQTIG